MPRIDHQVVTEHVLSYEVNMVLTLLLQELNVVRAQAGLPARTPEQIRQAVQQYLQSHPRSGNGG